MVVKFSKVACLTLLLAGSLSAQQLAGDANRNLAPIGETESLLGNTGAALPESTGSVYYNPAGLAFIEESRISFSGSAYSFNSQTVENIHIHYTPFHYRLSGTNTVPSGTVRTLRYEDWTLAYSILVPVSVQAEDLAHIDTFDLRGYIRHSTSEREMWFGGSAGRKIAPNLALGASLFGVYRSETRSVSGVMTYHQRPDSLASFNEYTKRTIPGLTAVLGLLYTPDPAWHIGASLQSPFVQTGGSATVFRSQFSASGAGFTNSIVYDPEHETRHVIPPSLRLGLLYRPAEALDLLLDVSYQAQSRHEPLPGLFWTLRHGTGENFNYTLNDGTNQYLRLDTDPTVRVNFGVQFRWSERFRMLAGWFYNPSSVHSINESLTELQGHVRRVDYHGATLGFVQKDDLTRTGIGLSFVRGRGERRTNPDLNNDGTFDSRFWTLFLPPASITDRSVGLILYTSQLF